MSRELSRQAQARDTHQRRALSCRQADGGCRSPHPGSNKTRADQRHRQRDRHLDARRLCGAPWEDLGRGDIVIATERQIHAAVIDMLRWGLPDGWVVYGLNNNPRSKVAGAIGKGRLGYKAGIPDIIIIGQSEDGHLAVFWMEIKAAKGRVSPEQRNEHDRLIAAGSPVAVVRSVQDVERQAKLWGWPLRAKVAA